ncbi:MAG: hypothetical protein ACE5GE_11350 [Phycisphaerae bacterium]
MAVTLTRRLGTPLIAAGLLVALAGCGSSGAVAASGGGGGPVIDNTPELPDEGQDAGPDELASINDGGGDLADRLGGATYTGQANGSAAAGGSLTLTFDDQGVLITLGGTVLGDFLGLGDQSDVIFDYQAGLVTGTVRGPATADQPLQEFLTDTQQTIELRNVAVLLTLDSLLITTTYNADLNGQPLGDREIRIEGTVRFATNEDIQGALILPGISDAQVPTFTLLRQ